MSAIFNPHEECEEPRVVLMEGEPGMGKTTYCKKVVFSWAARKHATENCFTNFLMVLLIKCRDVHSDLWEAIDDQLLPRDVDDDQRKRFFDFIRNNQSKVILVLDGLDEVSEKMLRMFSEIIQGRVLPKCRVVVTARHEAGVKVRKYCDTLLEVEGFTDEDARSFINKYFTKRKDLAEELTDRLSYDQKLGDMAANPLNCALFCVVWEEFNGAFPESRAELYMEIVKCVLRRYRAEKQLSEDDEDPIGLYESQLNHLGSIALKGLLEDTLDFDEKGLGKYKASDLPGLGFLSVQSGGSKLRPTRRYGFLHKTFQEFFAALNLACQLIKKEISTESIAADRRYRHELQEVLLLTFGILAAWCQTTAENLVKSMATQLNDGDKEATDSVFVPLKCIDECKNDFDFYVELAVTFGFCLQIKALDVSRWGLQGAEVNLLANILFSNRSVTQLNLAANNIGKAGVAALAECLKENRSLRELKLPANDICDDAAAALAECLKNNTSLTELILSHNEIGDDGAAALAECLKENTALKELNLSENDIGDDGAAALGKCLKENTSLTDLNLFHNHIGGAGAAALAECLKENTSLTSLCLTFNKIDDDGAAALAECLKKNTSLTALNLPWNKIDDDGAAALAECLKGNTSLTWLNLDDNNIAEAGAAALVECLKEKTYLTKLRLLGNHIGEAGTAALVECLKGNTSLTELALSFNLRGYDGTAALAECLKENTSLKQLTLSFDTSGYDGAAALAECLKENTSLTALNLSSNKVGDSGAAALAECLKENTSLKALTLSYNKIGDSSAAALAECLKETISLKELNLLFNKIGDGGAAALAECLKENTSLTELDLLFNEIGDVGATALAEYLKENTSLKKLNLLGKKIGDDGAAALAECLKVNTSLTVS
ncbi:NLR family CARD domain-containing protein 3-like [Stylophora pistillata]|nr:NLR family CARD domain-containing protein 3-like [Stylophora pistillata]